MSSLFGQLQSRASSSGKMLGHLIGIIFSLGTGIIYPPLGVKGAVMNCRQQGLWQAKATLL